jgi:MSHA biogenesis protein MshJ
MKAKSLQWLSRFESLSLRERLMIIIGGPVLLAVATQFLVFDPAVTKSAAARKQVERQQGEVTALSAAVAAQSSIAPLPAAEELLKQRSELQSTIEEARRLVAGIDRTVDWGTVVRATVSGTSGLALTRLRTLPPEVVFSPSMVKPAEVPATPAKTTAAPAVAGASQASARPIPTLPPDFVQTIYRHRAELTIKGEFGTLLGYLSSLQALPGDLHWDRLTLSVDAYPQASVQLNVHTLSSRPETPFN